MTDDPVQHHIHVRRTARYFILEPEGQSPVETWFVLHGYRQSAARFLRRFQALRARGCRVVAPEGLSRFYVDPAPGRHGPEHRVGASWMTREDREAEIRDYVDYLDELSGVVAPGASTSGRQVVLGFSQGAHTASRWVSLGRTRVDDLVLWGAGLAEDLSHERVARGLEGARLTFVRGSEDPHRSTQREQAQEELLSRLGCDFRVLVFDGAHEIRSGPLEELTPR